MVGKAIIESSFAALDFESAGAAPGETDVPVQVGIARMEAGLKIERESFFCSYIAPGREVSWAASKVHGITTDDLSGAPTLLSLWPEFKRRLGEAVTTAHSAATEKRFLRAFPFHGFNVWVDTLKIARAAYPEVTDHSLGSLINQLNLKGEMDQLCPDLQWHNALYDAVASLLLLKQIILDTRTEDSPISLLMRPDLDQYYKNRL